MQPRKYVKWTPKLRKWIIKQWQRGITHITEIARGRNIPRRSIYELINRFKDVDWACIYTKPRGCKKELLNANFVDHVLNIYAQMPRGCHKMWLELKKQGFSVSERKLRE